MRKLKNPFAGLRQLPEIPGALLSSRLDRSPVPAVLSVVLLWAVIVLLLTMAASWQRDPSLWQEGGKAPFNYEAMVDFTYVDPEQWDREKEKAAAAVPRDRFEISPEKTAAIRRRLEQMTEAVRQRIKTEKSGQAYLPQSDLISSTVAGIPAFQMYGEKISELLEKNAAEREKILKAPGIIDPMLIKDFSGTSEVEITLDDQRHLPVAIGKLTMVGNAAGSWAEDFPEETRDAITKIFCLCIGEGNLVVDKAALRSRQQEARDGVKAVPIRILRGERLIEKGQTITRSVYEKLVSEKKQRPYGDNLRILLPRLLIATVVVVTICFFLRLICISYFHFSLHFAFGAILLVLSLLIDCSGLYLFKVLWEHNQLQSADLLIFMVPIPLGVALLTVMQGGRVAVFGGILISTVMAFLVMPDHALSLILRWSSVGILVTMVMHNVTDHRSFFIRLLIAGIVFPLLLNLELLLDRTFPAWEGIAVLCACSFCSAVGALILSFFFEVVCNVDTNMSLMVLCGGTHPLLERMKREAPGTMSHSTTAATLAEDAARLIGANALKCKAGALFHDVGKLFRPQAFVENNIDSPKEYDQRTPEKCCEIIRTHVSEGLTLAREYRLSRFFKETILTHHGDDLVGGFYFRALREREEAGQKERPVESRFHYKGYPPFSREQTIIALADGCEAACRSFKHLPSMTELRDMVNNIFETRIKRGQLRNSELTLAEFSTVRESFIRSLISIHHGRMAYEKSKS